MPQQGAVGAVFGRDEGGSYYSEAFAGVFNGAAGTPTWRNTPRRKARATPRAQTPTAQAKRSFPRHPVASSTVGEVAFAQSGVRSVTGLRESLDYGGAAGKSMWSEPAQSLRRLAWADGGKPSHEAPQMLGKSTEAVHACMGPEFAGAAGCTSHHAGAWNFGAKLESSGAAHRPQRCGRRPSPRPLSAGPTPRRSWTCERRGKKLCPGSVAHGVELAALFHSPSASADQTRDTQSVVLQRKDAAGVSTSVLAQRSMRVEGMGFSRVWPRGRAMAGNVSCTCELAGVH